MIVRFEFELNPGDVWIDPDGVAWQIQLIDGVTVHLRRDVVTEVDAREMCRTWRQPNLKPGEPV